MDDLGMPLALASVEVLGPPSHGDFGDTHQVLGRALTDDSGRFSLAGLPPGPCIVSAESEENARCLRLPLVIPARDVELVCPRWGRVAFRLVPPPGESAPPWADLSVCYDGRSRWGGWRAHATDGAFEEGDFAPGPFVLTIYCRGWVPVVLSFTAEAGRTVSTSAIPLDRGHTVKGDVVDVAGAPIQKAWVHPEDYGSPDYLLTYTDAAGAFAVDHIPAGEMYFWASARGFVSRRFPVKVSPEAGETRVVLRRGGVIHVRIRTRGSGMPYSCFIRVVDLDSPEAGAGVVEGQVDGDGTFELSRRAGRYRIDHLRGPGGPVVASREVDLEVASERSVEFVEDWE